jgi:hypothetical protein
MSLILSKFEKKTTTFLKLTHQVQSIRFRIQREFEVNLIFLSLKLVKFYLNSEDK